MLDQTEKVIDKLVFHSSRSQPESVFIYRVLAETSNGDSFSDKAGNSD